MDLKPENPPTDAASIPKAVIFDTSVLSAIGKPTAPAYRATERLFLEHNITAYIPPCVIGEIHPESDPDIKLKPRILEAKNTGWMAEAKEFNELSQYNDGPKATEISDRVRTRMADGLRGVSEDEVEKTDTLLPGIAIQLLAGGEANRVGIAIKDWNAAESAHDVLKNTVYEDVIRMYRGRNFIDWILEQDDDYSSGREIY